MKRLFATALSLTACVGLQDLGDRPGSGGAAASASTSGRVTTSTSGGGGGGNGGHAPGGTKLIPGGTFSYQWRNNMHFSQIRFTHDFYVDTDEVTVGEFRAWVDAGRPSPCASQACSLEPNGPYMDTMKWEPSDDAYLAGTDYKTCNDDSLGVGATFAGKDEGVPINCASWPQAAAVCHFRGMRLLTDSEWQYLASGRGVGRTYPWGDAEPADCTQAIGGLGSVVAQAKNGCGFPKPPESAAGDVSRDGLRDLGGSVAEWVFDTPIYASELEDASLPDDWTGPTRGKSGNDDLKAIRGGSFETLAGAMKAVAIRLEELGFGHLDVGFRCAKTKL